MYYCTWGFFPLGFPGGPGYGGMYGLGSQFGTGPLSGAQPGVIPPKIGSERINGIGTGTGTPITFPGKRGRGRPRKNQPGTGTPGSSLVNSPSTYPGVNISGIGTGTPNTFPVKRGRGRPRKNKPSSSMHPMPGSGIANVPSKQTSVILSKIGGESINGTGTGTGTPNSFPVKRGRGRPRKNQPSPATFATPESGLVDVPVVDNVSTVVMPSMGWGSSTVEGTGTAVVSPSSGPVKRGRGRPRKNEANSVSYTKKMVAKKRVNASMKKVEVDMN